MKYKIFSIISTVVVFFVSCTKESSFEQDDPVPSITDTSVVAVDTIPSPDNGGLLKRLVVWQDSYNDSVVYKFRYTADGKLEEAYGVVEGKNERNDLYSILQQFHRNDKGLVDRTRIQTYFLDASGTPQVHWDVIYNIYFDETASKYKYALTTGIGESEPVTDSLAYQYDSDNHLSTVSIYHLNVNDVAHPGDQYEYFYNAQGNTTLQKASIVRNNTDREDWFIDKFTYDDMINPMNFGEEMLLTGGLIYSPPPSVNNFTSNINTINPDESFTVQYTYNSHNKPVTAIWKYNDGEVNRFKYYYLK